MDEKYWLITYAHTSLSTGNVVYQTIITTESPGEYAARNNRGIIYEREATEEEYLAYERVNEAHQKLQWGDPI